MSKKLLALMIALLMVVSITACGGGSDEPTEELEDSNTIEVTLVAEVAGGGSTPQFKITSNLPDETELLLTLEQGDYSA